MPLVIKLAESAEDIDRVFQVRHTVFAEEEGYYPVRPDKRIVDRFDVYPSTGNMMALTGDEVVGSLRVCFDEPGVGLPADSFFNFRNLLPSDARIIHGGHFCVKRKQRSRAVTVGLVRMSAYYAISHGATHAALPANPEHRTLFEKIGYQVVGEKFVDPETSLPMLPMVMEFAKMDDFFLNFVKANQLFDFIGDYERWFFGEGEAIIKSGDPGENAFILIEGTADVVLPGCKKVVGTLGPAAVFGELALLTQGKRSADVTATSPVQVMVLSQKQFKEHLIRDPEKAPQFIQLLGQRLLQMIDLMDRTVN